LTDPISSERQTGSRAVFSRLIAAFNGPGGVLVLKRPELHERARATAISSPLLRPAARRARLAMEIAMALPGHAGDLTALTVFDPQDDMAMMRGAPAGADFPYWWICAPPRPSAVIPSQRR